MKSNHLVRSVSFLCPCGRGAERAGRQTGECDSTEELGDTLVLATWPDRKKRQRVRAGSVFFESDGDQRAHIYRHHALPLNRYIKAWRRTLTESPHFQGCAAQKFRTVSGSTPRRRFGRAILNSYVPLGWLAEGAPTFASDRVPRASGFSPIDPDDVPVPERR